MKSLLDGEISKKGCFELKRAKDLGEDDIIPMVSDVMFKTMLGNESRKKYVCYLLSLILEKDYNEIYNNIVFVKNELDKNNSNEAEKRVDLLVTIDGTIYNIEMNNNNERTYIERNIEYINELYKSSRKVGSRYDYKYTFQVNLDNFTFENRKITSDMFMLRNEEGEILTDKIKILHIYLPKIKEKYYNKEKLNELEKLILIFNSTNKNDLKEIIGDNKIMEEYKKEALDASHDYSILGLYDRKEEEEFLKRAVYHEIEEKATKKGLEKGLEKGIKKGLEKGIKQGIEQGLEKGIEQGMKEGLAEGSYNKSIEIARSMLNRNMDISLISEITKLSENEIKNLCTK